MEVRLSKLKALLFAAVFILFTTAATPWALGPVSSETAFRDFQIANKTDRRCVSCRMDFQSYRSLAWTVVVYVNGFLGAGVAVGVLRAFGPPTLTLKADGRVQYVLPWRTREFQVPADARIDVTPLGLVFTPPLAARDSRKPLRTIPIRSFWIDQSRTGLVAKLRVLNPNWTVGRTQTARRRLFSHP